MESCNRRIIVSVIILFFAVASNLEAQTSPSSSVVDRASSELSSGAESPFARIFDFDQVMQKPEGPPPTPRHTGIKAMIKGLGTDVRHLRSRQNLFWVGVGSGMALAAHPFDDNVNHYLVGHTTAKHVFKVGAVLGQSPTLLSAASIVYATGRLKGRTEGLARRDGSGGLGVDC